MAVFMEMWQNPAKQVPLCVNGGGGCSEGGGCSWVHTGKLQLCSVTALRLKRTQLILTGKQQLCFVTAIRLKTTKLIPTGKLQFCLVTALRLKTTKLIIPFCTRRQISKHAWPYKEQYTYL